MRAQSATSDTPTLDTPQPDPMGSGATNPGPAEGSCRDLLDGLAEVVDPRKRRGIRHCLVSILTLAAAAVVAGTRTVVHPPLDTKPTWPPAEDTPIPG
ncbi:MAG: hypothetical protein ACRDR6_10045 [Pseudonocardiaceae bacterium]